MNRQDYFRMMRHSQLTKQAMVKNASLQKYALGDTLKSGWNWVTDKARGVKNWAVDKWNSLSGTPSKPTPQGTFRPTQPGGTNNAPGPRKTAPKTSNSNSNTPDFWQPLMAMFMMPMLMNMFKGGFGNFGKGGMFGNRLFGYDPNYSYGGYGTPGVQNNTPPAPPPPAAAAAQATSATTSEAKQAAKPAAKQTTPAPFPAAKPAASAPFPAPPNYVTPFTAIVNKSLPKPTSNQSGAQLKDSSGRPLVSGSTTPAAKPAATPASNTSQPPFPAPPNYVTPFTAIVNKSLPKPTSNQSGAQLKDSSGRPLVSGSTTPAAKPAATQATPAAKPAATQATPAAKPAATQATSAPPSVAKPVTPAATPAANTSQPPFPGFIRSKVRAASDDTTDLQQQDAQEREQRQEDENVVNDTETAAHAHQIWVDAVDRLGKASESLGDGRPLTPRVMAVIKRYNPYWTPPQAATPQQATRTPEQQYQTSIQESNKGLAQNDKQRIDPQTGLTRAQTVAGQVNLDEAAKERVYAQQKLDKKTLMKKYDQVARQRMELYRKLQQRYANQAKAEFDKEKTKMDAQRDKLYSQYRGKWDPWSPNARMPSKLFEGLKGLDMDPQFQQFAYRRRLNNIESDPQYAKLVAQEKRLLNAIGTGAHQML